MRWSSVYKDEKGWELLNDDYICNRVYLGNNARNDDPRYCWIIAKKPVFTGIHCWRLFIENPNKDWMTYAISKANHMYDDQEEYNYGQKGVIGIAYNDCWYPTDSTCSGKVNNDRNSASYKYPQFALQHFNKDTRMIVDILLDCDKGEVQFAVVGEPDKFRPKFWNINEWLTDDKNGWIPHINARAYVKCKTITARLAKIDVSYHGIHQEEIHWKSLEN